MVLVYYYVENDMDLFNNQVGRDIVSNGSTDILQDVLDGLGNGDLRYINNQNSDCQATYSSQIIQTNQ